MHAPTQVAASIANSSHKDIGTQTRQNAVKMPEIAFKRKQSDVNLTGVVHEAQRHSQGSLSSHFEMVFREIMGNPSRPKIKK